MAVGAGEAALGGSIFGHLSPVGSLLDSLHRNVTLCPSTLGGMGGYLFNLITATFLGATGGCLVIISHACAAAPLFSPELDTQF